MRASAWFAIVALVACSSNTEPIKPDSFTYELTPPLLPPGDPPQVILSADGTIHFYGLIETPTPGYSAVVQAGLRHDSLIILVQAYRIDGFFPQVPALLEYQGNLHAPAAGSYWVTLEHHIGEGDSPARPVLTVKLNVP